LRTLRFLGQWKAAAVFSMGGYAASTTGPAA